MLRKEPIEYLPIKMTKIVGTLGPGSQSVESISACLELGMAVARFDFSSIEHHQHNFKNLEAAVTTTGTPCAVMLDTVGRELLVIDHIEKPISLQEGGSIVLTPHQDQEASSKLLPIDFVGLAKAVKKGDTIFVGTVKLEVDVIVGDDVHCIIKNSATLAGSDVHIDLPTLSNTDKKVISTWAVKNRIDFLSLSYTQHAEYVRQYLSTLDDPSQTQIFAKIENIEALTQLHEILQEADGIILSCEKLAIGLRPDLAIVIQGAALYKCNLAGKPGVVDVGKSVVDGVAGKLRPTDAAISYVAIAVSQGCDAILLGADALYPVENISIVSRMCAELEKVFDQELYFKRTVKCVGESMSHLESFASSAVRGAIKVKASVIICFTKSKNVASLIAKYRPPMPVLSIFVPRLKTELNWNLTSAFEEARQSLIVRGIFPMLADPIDLAESTSATVESVFKIAAHHGKVAGVIKPGGRVVFCLQVGETVCIKAIQVDE